MRQAKTQVHSEAELIDEVKSGSRYAFDELYSMYYYSLYISLRRVVRDEDIIAEVVQDTFVKIWEKRSKLDSGKSFRAYLARVSRNLMVDFFRKIKRHQVVVSNLALFATEVSEETMESSMSVDEEKLLMEAIDQLPPQRKRIFLLCKIDGLSYDQVGQQLGISVSTISDHIVKATKMIKNQLHRDYPSALIFFVPAWYITVHQILQQII